MDVQRLWRTLEIREVAFGQAGKSYFLHCHRSHPTSRSKAAYEIKAINKKLGLTSFIRFIAVEE